MLGKEYERRVRSKAARSREISREPLCESRNVTLLGQVIVINEHVSLLVSLVSLGGVDTRENPVLVQEDSREILVRLALPAAFGICRFNLSPVM